MSEDFALPDGTTIPAHEVELRFVRSGGPGGQHVNTSATKVELRFDVAASRALTDAQKQRISEGLSARLTVDGVLVLHADEFRSQARNREAAVGRLRNLLADAVRPPRRRRPTRIPRRSRRARREAKRRTAERKRQRQTPTHDS